MDNIVEKIYKAGLKFLIPLSQEETNKMIVDETLKLVKADYASILLAHDGELERAYASDPILYKIKPRKRGYMYSVFKKRQPIVLNFKKVARIHPEINQINSQTDIIVPLANKNSAIGVLSVMYTKEVKYTKQILDTLTLFAPMASLAIRKTQLYDEAKQALEYRDLFISMAAHEFRTPITTISGYIQLLQSKLEKSKPTTESRWVEELSWEVQRLTQLVNELLAVDRIKTGALRYSFKECSLREIVGRAAKDFKFSHPDYKLVRRDTTINNQDKVIGDFDKLLQVIINLLDNAAKFSPAESEIVISLKLKSPNLILTVKDKGKGISKTDLPKLYERFYRGSDHTREGMGLGLFLAKNIIEHHRGEISIKSKEGKGATVEIMLPEVHHD
jgi:signal transduction histidine kinase